MGGRGTWANIVVVAALIGGVLVKKLTKEMAVVMLVLSAVSEVSGGWREGKAGGTLIVSQQLGLAASFGIFSCSLGRSTKRW